MMSQELQIKSKQLEDVQRHRDEQDEALSKQIQLLRIEIRKLMAEEHALSKTESKENMTTMLMLENNDEEEIRLGTLMSEVEILKTQHNELKHNLHTEQAEKENMKKKISQLEGELNKKEEDLSAVERRLENSNGQATATNINLASWHYDSAAYCSSTNEYNRISKSEMHKVIFQLLCFESKLRMLLSLLHIRSGCMLSPQPPPYEYTTQ